MDNVVPTTPRGSTMSPWTTPGHAGSRGLETTSFLCALDNSIETCMLQLHFSAHTPTMLRVGSHGAVPQPLLDTERTTRSRSPLTATVLLRHRRQSGLEGEAKRVPLDDFVVILCICPFCFIFIIGILLFCILMIPHPCSDTLSTRRFYGAVLAETIMCQPILRHLDSESASTPSLGLRVV